MPSGAAVSRGEALPHAPVHRPVVESHDLLVERPGELRLQNRQPIEDQAEIEEAAGPQQGQHCGEGPGHIHQVEQRVRHEQIPILSELDPRR